MKFPKPSSLDGVWGWVTPLFFFPSEAAAFVCSSYLPESFSSHPLLRISILPFVPSSVCPFLMSPETPFCYFLFPAPPLDRCLEVPSLLIPISLSFPGGWMDLVPTPHFWALTFPLMFEGAYENFALSDFFPPCCRLLEDKSLRQHSFFFLASSLFFHLTSPGAVGMRGGAPTPPTPVNFWAASARGPGRNSFGKFFENGSPFCPFRSKGFPPACLPVVTSGPTL